MVQGESHAFTPFLGSPCISANDRLLVEFHFQNTTEPAPVKGFGGSATSECIPRGLPKMS
jgi:hypothetical protein